ILLHDAASGRTLTRLAVGKTEEVAFRPDGELLALTPEGLTRWPCQEGDDGVRRFGPAGPAAAPRAGGEFNHFSLDGAGGRCARIAADRRSILLYDLGGNAGPAVLPFPDIGTLDVSPDGRLLAANAWAGPRTRLYDIAEGRWLEQELEGSGHPRFSPDGRL